MRHSEKVEKKKRPRGEFRRKRLTNGTSMMKMKHMNFFRLYTLWKKETESKAFEMR